MTRNEYDRLKIGDRVRYISSIPLVQGQDATITCIDENGDYPVVIRFDETGYRTGFGSSNFHHYELITPDKTPLPLPG